MDAIWPGIIAIGSGLLLAILALVPWVAVQYRKRGSLGFGPTVIALGTLIYALALVAYTMLPLPSDPAALCADGGAGQVWRPGTFLHDIAEAGGWALRNPAVQQVALNVLLFIPLGMIVHYVFARHRHYLVGVLIAAAAGFVVSAAIETTQLTGNWFLYPCAYRVFDVDDLGANTLGALLGGLLAPTLRLIPGQRSDGEVGDPRPVTVGRRLLGMTSDALAMLLISAALGVATTAVATVMGHRFDDPGVVQAVGYASMTPTALQLILVWWTGRTVGELVVRLQSKPRPGAVRGLIRWAFGSGGWWVLLQSDWRWSGIAAVVMALISAAAVMMTRGKRGLAALLAGLDIADDREGSAEAADRDIGEAGH